jgi:SAM-dependent methyltransferase
MNYTEIFAARGSAYDRAMQRWPAARDEDFRVPLEWLAAAPGEIVVDVPAGGGYLERYLPAGARWFGHEPCGSFQGDVAATATGAETGADLLPLPWSDGFADAAISIAGVHHLEDKRPLFGELCRVVKPGGRFVLADVHHASAVARFLDEFVGRHNSTGHAGTYLDPGVIEDLATAGWTVERAARVAFDWWFADRDDLVAYCRLLFDIRGVDDATLLRALENYLGLVVRDDAIGLNWELCLVRSRRGPDLVA